MWLRVWLRSPGSELQVSYFLAVWPKANDFISLRFYLLIYKIYLRLLCGLNDLLHVMDFKKYLPHGKHFLNSSSTILAQGGKNFAYVFLPPE